MCAAMRASRGLSNSQFFTLLTFVFSASFVMWLSYSLLIDKHGNFAAIGILATGGLGGILASGCLAVYYSMKEKLSASTPTQS
jgi:hypothetical protein